MNGGCHPVDGCQDGTPFLGSIYRLPRGERRSAQATNDTVLPAVRDRASSTTRRSRSSALTLREHAARRTSRRRSRASTSCHEVYDGERARARSSATRTASAVRDPDPPGRLPERAAATAGFRGSQRCDNLSGDIVDDRPAARRPGRRRRERSHARAVHLPTIDGKLVTQRVVVRPPRSPSIDARSSTIRRRTIVSATATNVIVRADVAKDPADHGADRAQDASPLRSRTACVGRSRRTL